jgi:hypothetical protein
MVCCIQGIIIKLALNSRIRARIINALNIIFRLEDIKERLAIDIESKIKIGVDLISRSATLSASINLDNSPPEAILEISSKLLLALVE